jgi:hypothetical protein
MAVGFLVPSNATTVPVQQTGLPEFTGAVAKHVPNVRGMLGLLVGAMSFCLIGPLL